MGFIEKVVGLMNASTEPTPNNSTEVESREAQPAGQNVAGADGASQEEEKEPRTYTPEELKSILDDKKREWLEEQKAEEEERIRNLPETERLKREQISKDDEIESLKAELFKRDLQTEIISILDEKRLPVSISELVQYGDRTSTMESLEKITNVFEAVVQEGIQNRLRGKTPEGLGGSVTYQNAMRDPFAQTFVNTLER